VTQPAFSHELSDDAQTLTLHGELDEGAAVRLRELLNSLTAAPGSRLRVDLSDVDFLPSPAVGVLAVARDTTFRNGGSMTFVAAPGTISQRVLTICALPYEES